MARKKSRKTLKVILISLAVITVLGLLSNASGCVNNFLDESVNDKSGWYLVNDKNELNNNDLITFVSDYSGQNRIIGKFNYDKGEFGSSACYYDGIGNFSLLEDDVNCFKLIKTKDFFAFESTDPWGDVTYLTLNTTKESFDMSPYISNNSKFEINFNYDYSVCEVQFNESPKYIKSHNTLFSLLDLNYGNFPYMYKWYGEEEPNFYFDGSLEVNYLTSINLNDYDIVEEDDLVLSDSLEIIPVFEKDNSIYLPIINEEDYFQHSYGIRPFTKKDNLLVSMNYIPASFTLKKHEHLAETYYLICNNVPLNVTEYHDVDYNPELLMVSKDNYRRYFNNFDSTADLISRTNLTTVYHPGYDELFCDPEQEDMPFQMCFYKSDDELIYFGAVRDRTEYDPDNEGGYISYFLVKKK